MNYLEKMKLSLNILLHLMSSFPLASGKEDIKCRNILKRYKKRLTLMML